jgi:hypothetical protein
MNLQDPYVALKAIYDIINHLGMIYMKFKSEKKIKEDLVFPRCETVTR